MSYLLFTDTGCDIPPRLLAAWNVRYIDLTFRNDKSSEIYVGSDIPPADFYQQMREGVVFKTSAANMEDFRSAFEPALAKGQDILYLGFSSGLSNTASICKTVVQELQEQYPQRKIVAIDSLCASGGQGMLVYLAVQKRDSHADLQALTAYLSEMVPHMCHWFTVDNLEYLKRGGRVSPTTALVGNLLGIKPILHVDDAGHLIKVSTIRGRKKAIMELAQKYRELATSEEPVYFISHGDCLADAKQLEDLIRAETGKGATHIVDIGPVIGAHSGPGTLALFFLGKNR